MKKYLFYFAVVVTLIIDAALVYQFHTWCAEASRTSILWAHGAFSAYFQAYTFAAVMCGMASMPILLFWDDLTEDIKH